MLMVGLTGGIGAGKSAVAKRLSRRGAVLVDSDQVAREVVAVGTSGLAEVVEAFGDGVLGPDGALDRQALAGRVFGDEPARRRLEAIIHPRVRARSAEQAAAAAPDAVVVNDVPLLVEVGLAPTYHLVVVVEADEAVRIHRLTGTRGMTPEQARARIAAQTDDAVRRAAADVLLRNDAGLAQLDAAVEQLWVRRLLPYEDNLRHGRCGPTPPGPARPVPSDPAWPAQAARLTARIRYALRSMLPAAAVTHVGATAVPGLPGEDVIDLMLAVDSLEQADGASDALTRAGFPRRPGEWFDTIAGGPDGRWPKRVHGSADPGRPVNLDVRVAGTPGWRSALLMRDHLRAVAAAREAYAAVGQDVAAEQWATRTGWRPPQL